MKDISFPAKKKSACKWLITELKFIVQSCEGMGNGGSDNDDNNNNGYDNKNVLQQCIFKAVQNIHSLLSYKYMITI